MARDETVQIGLRVKEPLRAALKEAADARGVPMNTEITMRLSRSFDRQHALDAAPLVARAYRALASKDDERIRATLAEILDALMPDEHIVTISSPE